MAPAKIIGPLLIAYVAILNGADGMREVDFNNFTYAWDSPRRGVPATWKWLMGAPKSSLQVTDGNHSFPSPSPFQQEFVMVRSVTYGDLRSEGREAAAVDLIYSTGGTANWHYLYVYALEKGSPQLLARLESGSRADGGLVKVTIEKNELILDFADGARRVGDCCSPGYIRAKYRWQSGRFVEVGSRLSGDIDLGTGK